MQSIDKNRMPEHVAIVMDGNGRWADQRGVPKLAGHNAGMKAMKEIVKRSSTLGVKYLTVYAFSTENWKRSKIEVSGIFNLLVKYVASELTELDDNNVIVKMIGDYSPLPQAAIKSIERAKLTTENNSGLQFNIALNYGARDEVLRAAAAVCSKGEEFTVEALERELYTAGIPDPDLVIRTSGEMRLSNFLLWQSAYSEFVFRDELWPDFTPEIYEEAIAEFQGRNRRFGGR